MPDDGRSKSINVYLAGAIEYAPDGGKAWRQEIMKFLRDELGHSSFDPTSEEWDLLTDDEKENFRDWKSNDLPRFRSVIERIIHHDLDNLMNKTEYVVCLWDEPVTRGGGTHGEMTTAFMNKIPVYMVLGMEQRDISSWIIGCTTEIFPDFESLKEFLKKKFKK